MALVNGMICPEINPNKKTYSKHEYRKFLDGIKKIESVYFKLDDDYPYNVAHIIIGDHVRVAASFSSNEYKIYFHFAMTTIKPERPLETRTFRVFSCDEGIYVIKRIAEESLQFNSRINSIINRL